MENTVPKRASMTVPLWFVARTIAHAELKMRDYFIERGIECFVPTKRELRKRKGEMTDLEIPLVPNLVFFKADYGTAHSLFNVNARRIYRIRCEGKMLSVPDNQMEPFMRFINENYGKVEILSEHFVLGDLMMVKKGPLAGMKGKVIQINNRNYFTISLDGLLIAAVKFPKSNLVKVAEAEKPRKKINI